MDQHAFLTSLLVYLATAILMVAIFRKLGLASILGYLAAGSILGPFGIGLVKDVKGTMTFAELGVVLLLFIIGLELKPSRLWALRKPVFGMGSSQILLTSLPIAAVCKFSGLSLTASIVVGVSLAFSSTAFALQILSEKKKLGTPAGRSSFAILLFQDLTAIPLLAAIPALGVAAISSNEGVWISAGKILAAIVVVVFGGRHLLRPAFRAIAATKTPELFTAGALLLVISVSVLMESIGLSMALGAFLAGVLLADSEYRHELEADIEPFKGLLLGLFFMAVGMGVDYGLIVRSPGLVALLVFGLLALKFAVLYGIGRFHKLDQKNSLALASVLPQGGEFAFVIFGAAVSHGILGADVSGLLVLVVTISMALTPFLVMFSEKVLVPRIRVEKKPFDVIVSDDNPVIIAGFGRFGQINGRILRVMKIGFTALDHDVTAIDTLRKFGNKVFYGDAAKLDILKAAGADKAKFFVLAVDDVATSLKIAEIVVHHFPHLVVYARARNRSHAFSLMDLGVRNIYRETLGSSLEMAQSLIGSLGVDASRAESMIARFRAHDDETLQEQYRVHNDEVQLIDVSARYAQQLESVLAKDAEDVGELRA